MSASLIAIDWGSTNCRAALLDGAGGIVERQDGGAGIFERGAAIFAEQLRDIVMPWRSQHADLPVILSGMIGSRDGMIEVPFVHCPASPAHIADTLHKIDTSILERCWIVPGVQGLTPDDVADVMRGEEVQAIGLLDQPGWESGSGLVILPGTHSKWLLLREGEIFRFATAASGELFATLNSLGSLAPLLKDSPETDFDRDVFRKGLTHARQRGGLPHHLFNLRARAVLREISRSELRTRLSALLIGHELEEMLAMFPAAMRVAVVGSEALGHIYCEALAARGAEATWYSGDETAARGMLRLAHAAGILETRQ